VLACSLLGKPGRTTRSCGCLRREIAVKQIHSGILDVGRFVLGHGLKLNIEQVRQIRALAARGMTKTNIALRFGVGKSFISAIVLNKNWKEAAA
jgi:hypothetical protein